MSGIKRRKQNLETVYCFRDSVSLSLWYEATTVVFSLAPEIVPGC